MKNSKQVINNVIGDTGRGTYINGGWLASPLHKSFNLVDPATEEITAELAEAGISEVDEAVAAARKAFDHGPWTKMSPEARGLVLEKLTEGLSAKLDDFCDTWTAQVGGPAGLAKLMLPGAINVWSYYVGLAKSFAWSERRKTSFGEAEIVAEPGGVCALIYPWNAPLFTLSLKLAPALLAGCTVVIKPALEAPLEAFLIAKVAREVGIPDGVINIVTAGPKVSEYLVSHPEIDHVSFTGSSSVGKAILHSCADRMARTSMELGGKSAAILLDDADFAQALATVAPWTMPFSGQACLAQTRILVPENRLDEATTLYCGMMSQAKLGDPWDMETRMGPVVTEKQMTRILNLVQQAKEEGAELALGGGRAEEFDKGFYIQPTVFTGVKTNLTLASEEVFGPVVVIMPYRDEQHAVEIANSTDYGLHGSVFSPNVERAVEVARQVRTGSLGINCFDHDAAAPFGGFKQSGIGREGGPEGLRSYVEYKTIYFQ